MDPVSALSVAGVALQLVGLCVTVSQSLNTLKDKYDEVGNTIRGIRRYCKVIEFAVRKVQYWIETTLADSDVDVSELAALQSLLMEYTEVVQDLKDDVDKIRGPSDSGIIRYGQKIKFVWKQDTMQQHLQELHYLSSAFHFLLDAIRLPLNQLTQVVNQTREHSRSISSSRCSLVNFRDVEPSTAVAVQFTFSEILANSAVYKRAEAYALAVSMAMQDEGSHHDDAALLVQRTPSFKDFRVPFCRNPRFCGREDVLTTLHHSLERNDHVPKVRACALRGLAGIGKTETALEYAYRQRESYDIIWWVYAESQTSIAMSYSSFNEFLGLTTSTNPNDHVRLVKKWLQSTELTWLLVLDNSDDMTQLGPLLPDTTKGHGSVILTARRWFSLTGITSIEVSPFTTDEGASFLRAITGQGETSTISNEAMAASRSIANILGGLPLAIAQIRLWMEKENGTLSEAQEVLEKNFGRQEMISTPNTSRGNGFAYSMSVGGTWSIALSQVSYDAMILLGALSFLDPDRVDEGFLLSESNTNQKRTLNLEELSSFSFVQIDKGEDNCRTISMHRLIQEASLLHLGGIAGSLQDAFQLASDLVRNHIPDTNKIKTALTAELQFLKSFLPHAISLASKYRLHSQHGLEPTVDLALLLVESSACMCRIGYWEETKSILPVAIDVLEESGVPADDVLYEKIATMQSFVRDWAL